MKAPIDLPFSQKYDADHARQYYLKHQDGLARRLSNWRDQQLARQALSIAGQPNLVLDLPSGAGRFWPLLAEKRNRLIIGADYSENMLATARAQQPAEVVARVKTLQTSAFAIDLSDNSVDCIFCMRLFHHVGEAADRLALLQEFHRVTRDSVILSLWVDGNFKAWRRQALERRRQAEGRDRGGYQNRFIVERSQFEAEVAQAGFVVDRALDFLPGYAMWRVYVLRKAN
ncbi:MULTISPECIES: class I SAM-dependent methyltransferase [Pseudomonas]|uniref:class I SAM-dependent methyltransferase n=1 Tax=Pseudomonas TaxID=286 RepID=UPI0008C1A928|nr:MULTISPECIES: class I SAM-dependent methyltransferase [Pseudomonas]MXS21780.1 methyltransferase domain-containing protein [Pseudomonas oryzihabitans]UUW70051.1 class I SAM-dependent methyltransferase [Pseudomonas psychrotolerans]SEP17059.1 Ubiquinone/menaquinone biosynthesis C-methylase UbiE [Pseudomonas sp. Snoq117.2]